MPSRPITPPYTPHTQRCSDNGMKRCATIEWVEEMQGVEDANERIELIELIMMMYARFVSIVQMFFTLTLLLNYRET